jgi:hypothetical protein
MQVEKVKTKVVDRKKSSVRRRMEEGGKASRIEDDARGYIRGMELF